MDQFKEFIDLGGDILNSVTRAVGQNDYSGLNADIQSSIRQFSQNTGTKYNPNIRVNPTGPSYNPGAGSNANPYPGVRSQNAQSKNGQTTYRQTQNGTQYQKTTYQQSATYSRQTYSSNGQRQSYPGGQGMYNNPTYQQTMNQNRQRQQQRQQMQTNRYGTNSPFFIRKPSYTGSLVQIIIGIIGMSLNGLLTLAMLAGIFMAIRGAVGVGVFFLALTAAFGALFGSGMKSKKLLNEFYRYGRFLGNSEYIKIEDLAKKVGEVPDTVYRNLEKMIKKNYLPQARFDAANTTMMLTNGAYNQYQTALKSQAEREAEEKRQQAAREQEWANLPENVRAILREGERYIQEVHHCNDLIPGEEMTRKLSDLESIVRQIFAQLKEHPEQADDLRKLMNYYLPTTEKLLHAYIDLDKQTATGQNVETARKEIEDVIDTINVAFQQLLDNLFQKVAWDVSTDISVMKSMMSQDGLDVMEDITEEQAAPQEVEVEVESVEEAPAEDAKPEMPALEFGTAPEVMEPVPMPKVEEPSLTFRGTDEE